MLALGPTARLIQIVLYCFNLVLVCIGLFLFWKRRRIFPLDQRGFRELAAMVVCGMFYVTATVTFDSCIQLFIFRYWGIPAILVWDMRALRLLFRYQIQQVLFRIANIPDNRHRTELVNKELQNWFIVHRRLSHFRTLAIPCVVMEVFCVVMLVVSYARSLERNVTTTSCIDYDGGVGFFTLTALLGIFVIVGVVISCFFRGLATDTYLMKREMMFCAGGMLVILAVFQAAVFLTTDEFRQQTGMSEGINNLTMVWVSLTSIYWPLSMTIDRRKSRELKIRSIEHASHAAKDADFQSFLLSPDGGPSFRKFLRSEFSLENLVFVEEVWSFRNKVLEAKEITCVILDDSHSGAPPSDKPAEEFDGEPTRVVQDEGVDRLVKDRLIEDCLQIIERFLRQEAHAQVNVSAKVFKPMQTLDQATLTTWSLDELAGVFDQASHEILSLMEHDSWPRYRLTLYYERLLLKRSKAHPEVLLGRIAPDSTSTFYGSHASRGPPQGWSRTE